MLYSIMSLITALLAGLIGFAGVALATAGIANSLFLVCLLLFLAAFISHAVTEV